MSAKTIRISIIAIILVLALASFTFAQRQTGLVFGKVTDKEGNPLPGAIVSISGPSLMGLASYVTSSTGLFRFPSLLPGIYELRAEMPGFKTMVRPDLIVNVGKTTEVVFELEVATIEEEVTITAVSPVVDVESSKVSVNYSAQFLSSIPMNRDLYDIQNSIPGAVSEGVSYRRTSSILGGTVRSQLYMLDGVPMNDPATFYSMVNINVDVYEEVEFEFGGHPAEVGQTDSTYVNIVSKSGGNTYAGGATLYYTGKKLAEDLISPEDALAYQVNPPDKYNSSFDFSLNIGGPVMEDRAWFFLNGRRYTWSQAMSGNPEVRMANLGFDSRHYDYDHQEWLGFAKLTVQIAKDIRYMGMFHYNHIYEPVYQNSGGGDKAFESTETWDHENTYTTTHQVNYILDQNTYFDLRGTYIHRSSPFISATQNQPTYYDYKEDVWWGASPYNHEDVRNKMLASASATRFQDDFLGTTHEFKAGAEFEQSEYHQDWYRGNPYYSYWHDFAAGNPYYEDPSLNQGLLRIHYCPPIKEQWDVQDNIRRLSGYVQDSTSYGRFTVNVGLRLDYSYQYEPLQSRPELRYAYGPDLLNPGITEPNALLVALNNQWHTEIGPISPFDRLTTPYKKIVDFFTLSPRAGIVYDISGDGRTALKLTYSRYHEAVWATKYNASQLFRPGSISYYWNDLNANKLMDLPPTDSYVLQSYPLQDPAYTYFVDNLKAPYTDEILAGVEHEFIRDFKLGLGLIWKQSKNIVEDTDINNGYDPKATDSAGLIWIPFIFTDPGWDGQWSTADDQTMTVYGLRSDRPVPTWKGINPSEAKRKYWALALTLDKRMSNRWQLKGSVVYCSFKGNVEATYLPTEGESTVFNNPNTLVNTYGSLWFDRPIQVKLMGTLVLPYDIIVSAYFQHYSGIPWNRTIARVYFPSDFRPVQETYVAVNAEVSGSRRRAPYTTIDFRIEKGFSVQNGKVEFFLDVFNLAGRSGVIVDDNPAPWLRFDQVPRGYEASSTYGNILNVYGVRSLRLGARWSF